MVRGPSRRAFGKLSPSSGQAELECFRRNRMILRNLSAAASALALAACAVGPDYKAPQSASAPAATGAFVSANSPAVSLETKDRKSTRLNPVTNAHLVCRLLLEKKNIKEKTHQRNVTDKLRKNIEETNTNRRHTNNTQERT